jgi:hypothetical protein
VLKLEVNVHFHIERGSPKRTRGPGHATRLVKAVEGMGPALWPKRQRGQIYTRRSVATAISMMPNCGESLVTRWRPRFGWNGVVQELRGRAFSIADLIQIALHRFLPMVGVAICTSILIGLATI